MEKEKLFLLATITKSMEDKINYFDEYEIREDDFNDKNCLFLFEKIKEMKTISLIDCFKEINDIDS